MLQSCLRTGYPSKRDSEMLKTRIQQSEFRGVKQSRIYAILFKILKLIVPHRYRVTECV